MKTKKLKIVQIGLTYFILVLISLSSCKKDAEVDNSDLSVLFQYEYMNWAWGYSHDGWFVDNQGNVKSYNLPDSWKRPDSLGYISKDNLEFNYSQADTIIFQIETAVLKEKELLIMETLNGMLSEPVNSMADAGQYVLYCYYWDSTKNMYKRQFLTEKGDMEQYNTDPEAILLADWLIEIGNQNESCFMFSCL